MNKISLFILLVLTFLGLSKTFSPQEQKNKIIINERALTNNFKGDPLSIILLDSFQAGFLIKTYYLKLMIVHGFKRPETIFVRTTYHYWKFLEDKLGMSIFRRFERTKIENTTPLPPGSIFIGNLSFGNWKFVPSGKKVWKFHNVYRHFPQLLGWGTFRPSFQFYEKTRRYQESGNPYYGENKEFGTKGTITRPTLTHVHDQNSFLKISSKEYFNSFLFFPTKKNNWGKKDE